jgi:2-methylcitrate dehydratase PrpD
LNLPYCVATLLLDGDVFVDQFSEEKVTDAERRRVANLVEVIEDPAITARGPVYRHMVHVTLTLRDGTVLNETVEAPRGSEHSFASAEDVIAKFRKLASRRLAAQQVERIVEKVMQAEKMSSASELVNLLASAQ